MFRVGIDTGGTFTDLVALDEQTGEIRTVKVPSTPHAPAAAPLAAVRQCELAPNEIARIVLGTTIAANARLEKKGATVLYVGTQGVEDVPIIARIDRKEAYNPAWPKPDSGIKRRHVFGIKERIDHKGNVLTVLDEAELNRMAAFIDRWIASDSGTDWAVAVNLLFSYVNPAHEATIGAYLKQHFPDLPVSLSHRVCPIWREYERATTTITDAFIKRMIDRFVNQFATDLTDTAITAPLALMKSNGGHVQSDAASDVPVQLLLSGLAGGVIAAGKTALAEDTRLTSEKNGLELLRAQEAGLPVVEQERPIVTISVSYQGAAAQFKVRITRIVELEPLSVLRSFIRAGAVR